MNNDELTVTVNALYRLCMAQAGKLAAMETISGAVIASLGVSLPPLIEQIAQHANGLLPYHRDELEPESLKAFDATLASFTANLKALAGS